jgi:Rrf2 family protein
MAMAELARLGSDGAVPLPSIAERQQLSVAYLEQIFLRLRRTGLVESARGRTGGYRLGRPAAEITVAEIMAAAEEETRMTRCLGENGPGCLATEKCLTHNLWHELGIEIREFLAGVTLQDVLEGLPRQREERARIAARAGARAS